jgi:hypothetical protein
MNRAPLERSGRTLAGFVVDAATAGRLLVRLPFFVRRQITIDEARMTVGQRLVTRETNFLALLRRAVYDNSGSPYMELLSVAGCEYGDVENLVREHGLEGALQELYGAGVYLTVAEFKGRESAKRGSATITVDPARLVNPTLGFHVMSQSSGSRGTRTRVPIHLDHIHDRAFDLYLVHAARQGLGWANAYWGAPGGAAVVNILLACRVGSVPAAWFSHLSLADVQSSYRLGIRVLRAGSAFGGRRIPHPVHASLERPDSLLEWISGALRRAETPHIYTYVSAALRLCRSAAEAEIDLSGAVMTITGEPITASRLAAIEATGATAATNYGMNEAGGFLGYSCLRRESADEIHFMDDLHAVIQVDDRTENDRLPDGALLLSSLMHSAPLILLNVSTGDRASVNSRMCGCPLERYGWTTHLHTIRSFEKLTLGATAFHRTDVIAVLEEDLPSRFGGGPTDYQLVEDQTAAEPVLRLLIDPSVGAVDANTVTDAFLTAIGRGSAGHHVGSLLWRRLGAIRVERRTPLRTASGKFQHVHLGDQDGSRSDTLQSGDSETTASRRR